MIYPFCFPIVYHGLISGHTRKNQVEIVNWLLRGEFVGDGYGNPTSFDIRSSEVSKYVNGRDTVPNDKVRDILEKRDEMPERVSKLNLDPDMEFVTSAFHTNITLQSRLNKTDKERLENIIFIDNDWKEYISEAILLSLSYSADTSSIMTDLFRAFLHNLHLRDEVRNLFRLTKNERVHYLIERDIPDYIKDETLLDFWQRTKKAEIEQPGRVSPKAYKVLEELTAKGAKSFQLVASAVLSWPKSSKFFILDTSMMKNNPLDAWIFASSHFISVLRECGLLSQEAPKWMLPASDLGIITFGNRNYDMAVRAYTDMGMGYFDLNIIELTDTGSELLNILDLKPDKNYLLAAAYALNEQYKNDGLEFVVLPITKDAFNKRLPENDKTGNLLMGFSYENAIAEVEQRIGPQALQIINMEHYVT